MKNLSLILIIGLLFLSCSKNVKEFEGDLYFKLIDVGSFHEVDDKTIEKFEKYYDSIRFSKMAAVNDLEVIRVFDVLKANDLTKAPWINLKTESDVKKIFLSKKEYEKMKKFDRKELVSENKKVILNIKVTELDSGIYYSDKILKVKLIDGKTYWRK